MGVRLYLHKRADENHEHNLRLIVCRSGRQIAALLPVKVPASRWSQSMQRVKPSTPGATDLNKELQRFRNEAQALALAFSDDDDLKAALLERLGRAPVEPEPTLLEHLDAFLAYKGSRVKEATMKVFRTMRSHLRGFIPSKDLRAEDIGQGFIEDFQTYLLGKGLANRSANKYAARLRTFLLWLESRGKIESVPKVKPLQTAKSRPIRLTMSELAALRDVDLSAQTEGHAAARDIFLMCCFTGQRIGDIQKMQWKEIRGDAWYMREEKTGVNRRIPLIAPALEIIERNKGGRRPLPRLSEQTVNDYIKTVAKLAKLNTPVTLHAQKGGKVEASTAPKHEVITTHVGRKTYVSLMMESGVSAKEMLGITHSDLRSLRDYAGASEDEHLRKAMHGVFEPLSTKTA